MTMVKTIEPLGNNSTEIEKPPQITETEVLSREERDTQALARLGKKPILKVWPES